MALQKYSLLLGDCRWSGGGGTDAVDGRGVDGFLGGDDAGVRNSGADVMTSRNESSCLNDSALCRVSRGLIGGTPPHPSIAAIKHKQNVKFLRKYDVTEISICIHVFLYSVVQDFVISRLSPFTISQTSTSSSALKISR